MKNRTIYIFFVFAWLIPAMGISQNKNDLELALSTISPSSTPAIDFHRHSQDARGLSGKVGSAVFHFYKSYISSQDSRRCMYALSCSAYAMEAVRAHGFWSGLLMGLDRYTRCNGQHRDFYPEGEQSLLLDPVPDSFPAEK